jgi:ABC-type branched-subunit amino acid transport system substrate-binding protein
LEVDVMRACNRQSLLLIGIVVSVSGLVACKRAKARNDEAAELAETAKETKQLAADGVSDDEIRLAQIATFTGPQAGLGTELYRGAMAYFLEVNSKGGFHGRKVEISPIDDRYSADGGEQATDKAVTDEHPFAVFGASGTEPTGGILKTLKKYDSKKMFLWGTTSGAEVSREGQYAPFAYNIRGSLNASGKDIIDAFAAAGFKKIGIVAQDDGFGKSAAHAGRKAAEERGMTVVAEVPISKAAKPDTSSANDIIPKLKSAGAEAIILAATYNPSTVFIRDARAGGWQVPAATMGTPDTMLRQLVAIEKKTGKRMTNAVLGCTNAPPVGATELAAVRDYRELVDKRNPHLPTEIADPNYRPLRYSTNALEGYLNARVFGEVLERTGKNLTRETFRKAAESIVGWDPGIGQKITFGANDNQGFDSIWLSGIKGDEFILVSDMKRYLTDKPEPVIIAKEDGDTKDGKTEKNEKNEKTATTQATTAAANAKTTASSAKK